MSKDAEKHELLQEIEPVVLIGHDKDRTLDSVNNSVPGRTQSDCRICSVCTPPQEFTHVVESVLERVRDGIVPIDEALIALLRDCGQHIGSVISRAAQPQTLGGTPHTAARAESLMARLQYYLVQPHALPDLAQIDSECCYPELVSGPQRNSGDAVAEKAFDSACDDMISTVQTVSVETHKVDRLIDLVGELTMASAAAGASRRGIDNRALHEAHLTLARVVQEVCDSAMQLRRVKIGATFERFRRMVHEFSRELGKDIELSISGEEIELDKTLAENIADSLTHLVINSMEHGIESMEIRTGQRKPARGRISLNAYHDSGRIVIEVGDDGGGLDEDKIHAKAVKQGLAEAGEHLTEQEICRLIFELGFSTAEQMRNPSGRGVGLDVVKRNITALHGTVSVHSRPGLGTTVVIGLPLAQATMNGTAQPGQALAVRTVTTESDRPSRLPLSASIAVGD